MTVTAIIAEYNPFHKGHAYQLQEAKKLGFTTCVMPAVCMKGLKNMDGIKVIGVKSVQDAIDLI